MTTGTVLSVSDSGPHDRCHPLPFYLALGTSCVLARLLGTAEETEAERRGLCRRPSAEPQYAAELRSTGLNSSPSHLQGPLVCTQAQVLLLVLH